MKYWTPNEKPLKGSKVFSNEQISIIKASMKPWAWQCQYKLCSIEFEAMH